MTLRANLLANLLAPTLLLAVLSLPAQADMADDALRLINTQRTGKGCVALSRDPGLQSAAAAQARDMAQGDFFGHKGKNGSTHAQRFRKAGYPGKDTAENIAAGPATAAAVVGTWLDSREHRANMLNCRFRDTGMAVVYQADDAPLKGNSYPFRYYWVQTFGGP